VDVQPLELDQRELAPDRSEVEEPTSF
jgi:hypothetical protein